VTEPIARIEAALRDLGADHEPPVGWEARVLAATASRKPWRWWWLAAPAVAAAVVVIVILGGHGEPGLQIALTYTHGNEIVRGDTVKAGDIVHATATGGGRHHAIWIYRNEVLVMACPGARECRIAGDAITADAKLAMGKYVIVVLTSDSDIPPPAGSYDSDLARAREAGADVVDRRVNAR
jgi:hypothetical protein